MRCAGSITKYEPRWIRVAAYEPIIGISFLCPTERCDGRHRIRIGFADLEYWTAAGRPLLFRADNVIPNDFRQLSIVGPIDDTSDGFCDFKGDIKNGQVLLV